MRDDVDKVAPDHIRAFLLAERERTSPAFAQQHYRNLHVYFRWIEAEGERLQPNPMVKVEKPSVPEVVKPFFTETEITALLRACNGQDFESRRDTAIIRILVDTGVRVSGLVNLRSALRTTRRPTCSCNCAGSGSRSRVETSGGFRSAAKRPQPSTATCEPGTSPARLVAVAVAGRAVQRPRRTPDRHWHTPDA
jgi:site-specific recombinase XerD